MRQLLIFNTRLVQENVFLKSLHSAIDSETFLQFLSLIAMNSRTLDKFLQKKLISLLRDAYIYVAAYTTFIIIQIRH